jgi:DNA modification methylase
MAQINVKPDICDVLLSEIQPAPYNPREISDEALTGLRESLERFGVVDLLVINKRNMRIVSGHQRYKVLQEAGVEKVTVIMVDVDEISEMAMNVTLNSQEIAGQWTAALIPLLEKLRTENGDAYIALRMKELRDDVRELEKENKGMGRTLPDDLPEPPKEVISKLGDLWILGDHRLLCGDSTKDEDVARLMDGHKANLFATDPPYCVDYTGAGRPTGGKDWSGVYHEIDIPDARVFIKSFYEAGLKHIKENTALYLWHASKRRAMIEGVCDSLNLLIHQQIIWVKPCAILTYSFYSWRHEPCLLMWIKGNKPPYRPKDKSIGSVWTVDFVRSGDPTKPEYHTDVWELDWEGKKRNSGIDHPTVKPTEVFAIPMRVHTSVGDICYEPFCGSGSQIIAGERLSRRVFAMEIEPFFVDVAIKRWEEFTGQKAVKT